MVPVGGFLYKCIFWASSPNPRSEGKLSHRIYQHLHGYDAPCKAINAVSCKKPGAFLMRIEIQLGGLGVRSS